MLFVTGHTEKILGCNLHEYKGSNLAQVRGFPGGSVVKNPPAMQETQAPSRGQEDPLEEDMATHSRTGLTEATKRTHTRSTSTVIQNFTQMCKMTRVERLMFQTGEATKHEMWIHFSSFPLLGTQDENYLLTAQTGRKRVGHNLSNNDRV